MIDALAARRLPRAADIAFRVWRWWISELGAIAPGMLGHTDASASLVQLLEASPMFDRVSYLSPVTRSRAGGGKRFGFVIKLRKS